MTLAKGVPALMGMACTAAPIPPPRRHSHRYIGVLAPNSPLRLLPAREPAVGHAGQRAFAPSPSGEGWGGGNGHGKFHYQGWHNCHDR